MSPEMLEDAGKELFGESWKTALSTSIGRDTSTRRRHAKREAVPGPVQAAVVGWLILKRYFGVLPPASPGAPFVSTLTGKELPLEDDDVQNVAATAEKLFGAKWKRPMAEALGVDRTSLWRLATSGDPSGPVLAALRAWLLIYRSAGIIPPFDLDRFAVLDERATRKGP